jgi:hypothetical protein
MEWPRKLTTPEPKTKAPTFAPATDAQKDSIWYNLQYFKPGDPEWDKAMGMMNLTGPPDFKGSYSRLSEQQASKVITYLRSFG